MAVVGLWEQHGHLAHGDMKKGRVSGTDAERSLGKMKARALLQSVQLGLWRGQWEAGRAEIRRDNLGAGRHL